MIAAVVCALLTAAPGSVATVPTAAPPRVEPVRAVEYRTSAKPRAADDTPNDVIRDVGPPPAPPEPEESALPLPAPADHGIPSNVLAAYRTAEKALAESHPGCHLRWYHLAGVGQVESGHARGGRATPDGEARPHILGPVLDGGAYAAIHDTDGGEHDDDPTWDRAVGPMQFIPGTWRRYGVDGNGDGVTSPHNIVDSAVAAGRYLCSGDFDLERQSDLDAALYRYNHSKTYVELVESWMRTYSDGTVEVTPLAPGEEEKPPTETPEPTPTTEPTTTAEPTDPTTVDPSAATTPPTTTDPSTTEPVGPTPTPTEPPPPPSESQAPTTTEPAEQAASLITAEDCAHRDYAELVAKLEHSPFAATIIARLCGRRR
ncbi:lytic transglycosylase domain-containing protein [Saccharothrix violaceirubra]|uniref:Outer membrane biosynthesis protein TonB n=1 Tax=Saccharothrix violaceirubra TaxID=413306 RepID=A0A7W7SXV0_9PSEU|nr:lytic murein transglycosylase [Saccharothrix violaceirubra]MBB4962916.1 outer membrane biosynthesis protein TonB [Saccharothrix violaceirubra]